MGWVVAVVADNSPTVENAGVDKSIVEESTIFF
jgi:hypothetical protein